MLDKYAELMVNGFWDDPGVAFQLENIPNGRRVFTLQCKGEVEAFNQLGCVTTYGNGDGMAIAYAMSDMKKPEFLASLQKGAKYLLEEVEQTELVQMSERACEVLKISNPDWFVPYAADKDVLIIQILVIRKEVRGTGLLTKMLEPLFEMSKEKDMKIALQTHNPENLPKYYHYGFKLIEQHSTDDGKLTCYNLLY